MVFKYGGINGIKYQNLTYVKPVILCMRYFELIILQLSSDGMIMTMFTVKLQNKICLHTCVMNAKYD